MTPQATLDAYLSARTRTQRDDVIAAYWYLCLRGAKKFLRAGADRADLMQVAAVGLIKAVDHFDPKAGAPFEAYAWLVIVGELMHYVRDHERAVRTPRPLRALEKQFARETERLTTVLGRPPNDRELARELRIDFATLDEIRTLRRGGSVVSIEVITGSPAGDLPAHIRGLSLDERLTLMEAIDTLGERERTVVLGSFAAGLSQAELGRKLGLSQSQVSKLIKRALLKIGRQVA